MRDETGSSCEPLLIKCFKTEDVSADYSGSMFYNSVQPELFLHCDRPKPFCD